MRLAKRILIGLLSVALLVALLVVMKFYVLSPKRMMPYRTYAKALSDADALAIIGYRAHLQAVGLANSCCELRSA
jgi:flagellar biosynthesis/type III secretory pathway M-ring protein FliF/YscJ